MTSHATDTIVAIATPPGRGGVGIVRLSGLDALSIATRITKSEFVPRKARFTKIISFENEVLDHVVVVYYQQPASFTGEDVVELQCHGSPVVLDQVVELCILSGARMARPGEFTERAFLNDKIDLAEAEAIADLINAQSRSAAKMALRSLEGEFSRKINAIAEDLLNLRLFVEATIDFPDEDLDFIASGKVIERATAILGDLEQILHKSEQGALLRDGIKLVIAGPPNAGKSTLFNYFAGHEAAIVTDLAGTTRDILRESVIMDGIPLHILDTAGIRDTTEIIEEEGIKRALNALNSADVIIWMIDGTKEFIMPEYDLSAPIIYVMNKQDLQSSNNIRPPWLGVSLKTQQGLNELKAAIKEFAGVSESEGLFLARRRHIVAINNALEHIRTGLNNFELHKAGELLAEDLKIAHEALFQITGKISSDDLLGHIFSTFCIGK